MATIEVGFEDFKRLTVLRKDENDTYADVVRRLLDALSAEVVPPIDHQPRPMGFGFWIKDLHLPDGTELSANYKNRIYTARIEGDAWVAHDGIQFNSASAAARAITGNTVNGLRFWSAKLPGSNTWRRLDTLMSK